MASSCPPYIPEIAIPKTLARAASGAARANSVFAVIW
jgi:hypothetical protein